MTSSDSQMCWASAVSDAAHLEDALVDVHRALRTQLGHTPIDLVLVFVSMHHAETLVVLPGLIHELYPNAVVVGSCAASVIGGGREVEHQPGLAIAVGHLPDVFISPFHLTPTTTPPRDAAQEQWQQALGGLEPEAIDALILLPDPFSCDSEGVVQGLDEAFPDTVILGGLVSGSTGPGQHALLLNQTLLRQGLVGVALGGNIEVTSVVAQGCRPIGTPLFITRAHRNLIFELDGAPAVDVLRMLFEQLPVSEQQLAQRALHIGLVMYPQLEDYQPEHFLIRDLLGLDPESGALAVSAPVQTRQVIQFHVRDARASTENLRQLLEHARAAHPGSPALTLMFSCLGRGVNLYGHSQHDIRSVLDSLGAHPIIGFFGNGEIGPVTGQTFLHGYTCAMGMLRPKRPPKAANRDG